MAEKTPVGELPWRDDIINAQNIWGFFPYTERK